MSLTDCLANASHLTDDTLVTRGTCQPGEIIPALVQQTSANPLHEKDDERAKEASHKVSAHISASAATLGAMIRNELEKYAEEQQEKTNQKDLEQQEKTKKKDREFKAAMEQLSGQVVKLKRTVEEQGDKIKDLQNQLDAANSELLDANSQLVNVNSQLVATQRRELDGIKDHLAELQATSGDIVAWLSGNVSLLLSTH